MEAAVTFGDEITEKKRPYLFQHYHHARYRERLFWKGEGTKISQQGPVTDCKKMR